MDIFYIILRWGHVIYLFIEESDIDDTLNGCFVRTVFLKERGVMVRQLRFVYLPLVGMFVVCLVAWVYMMAGKRSSKREQPANVIKHTVDTPAEDALKYWTEDKMRKAKAAKMPNVDADALERGKKRPRRSTKRPSV